MRSLMYSLPPGLRRIVLLVSLVVLALLASIPIALPFASGTSPQANALSSQATPGATVPQTPELTPTAFPRRGLTPTPGHPSSTPTAAPARPTSTPTPKPVVTPKPTPTPKPGWKPILQQAAPNCNNPAGTVWGVPSSTATSITCTRSGTLMRQATSTRFAEMDLNAVNGTTYDQNTFRLQVQISFPSPVDSSTMAAIILRTPATGCGGFIFTLAPSGHWQLQNVVTCTNIPTVTSGTTSINASQLTSVVIQGQNKALSISINGKTVLPSYGDGSNILNGEVGLLVERPGGTSSTVQYSNFILEMWR